MGIQVQDHFPQGINLYVKAMQFTADLIQGAPSPFSLGTPAVANTTALDTDIVSDDTAGTDTAQSYTADSPYGRTLTMDMDADPGAALGVYDVYGWDYLGQPMVERFTHVNGATDIIYGNKAFHRVEKVTVVTASTNTTTVNLGIGHRLGLPFKGDIIWARENAILMPLYNRDFEMWSDVSDADFTAGISKMLRAPCPGFIKTLLGTPNGAGSTNDPVITVELGGNAITGLTVTVDTSNAAGLTVTDTPTAAGYNANNRFAKDGIIELVSAAAASAGSGRLGIEITPTQWLPPDLTTTQTNGTDDPRGTYESLTTMDGTLEIIVGLLGEPSVNSSGDGGLHGIAHFHS